MWIFFMNKYCTGGQPERVYVCERGPPFFDVVITSSTSPHVHLTITSLCVEGRALLPYIPEEPISTAKYVA
jgi:hypothetical protein